MVFFSHTFLGLQASNTYGSIFWYKGLMINEETFLFQFDLVCNRDWYVTLTQSMFMLGFMLGVFSSGLIADRYLKSKLRTN
jgi:hypothetical protein